MATYDDDLLDASRRLLMRRTGQTGRIAGARVRRSISTTYYALFHFLLDEVTAKIVGTGNDLRTRRRVLGRTITHRGLRTTLDKIKGARVNESIALFVQPRGNGSNGGTPPLFAQSLARAFIDAQKKRESADYDLDEPLSETDARLLRFRVRRVIKNWRAAKSPADRDFKHAIAILILLSGKLRQDN